MSLFRAAAAPLPMGTPSAVLFNEGLYPGVRVVLDDRRDETATVCSVDTQDVFAFVRLDRTGRRVRLATWRLSRLD